MEDQTSVGDQNTQQIGQNLTSQPAPVLDKPKTNMVLVFVVAILCSLTFGMGGFYLGKQSSNLQPYGDKKENQPSPIPTEGAKVETSLAVPSTIQNIPSGTEDWKSYADKTYAFRYPSTWNIQPGSSDIEEYFGGDYIQVVAPSPTVTIEIAPAEFAYGFEGPVEHKIGETFKINIGGREYSGTEDIRTEEGKTKVFVNMTVPIAGKEFHILFGTGYPVNQDSAPSYSDYQKYRDTILKILSTLTIKN